MLTPKEETLLIELLNKMEWPLSKEVFHALWTRLTNVSIEFFVIDDHDRVLMIYRDDHEYVGYHMPGTVLRDNETVPMAIQRLIQSELPGNEITKPMNIGWSEVERGSNTEGKNPTRHEVSLFFLARLGGIYVGEGKFFLIDDPPENTLEHHKKHLEKIRRYIKTGIPILGK